MDEEDIGSTVLAVIGRMSAVIFVLLLAASFTFAPYPGGTGLDTSWQALLTYGQGQGFQFGKDVVFTYGPLSYLVAGQAAFTGLFWSPYFAGLLFDMALAILLLLLIRPLHPVMRALAVTAMVFFGLVFDAQYLFFMGGGALLVISRAGEEKALGWGELSLVAVWSVMVGTMALTKFSFLLLAAVVIPCCVLALLCRGGWRWALAVLLPSMVPLVLTYTVGSQSPASFFPFLKGALLVAGGYGEAMSIFALPGFLPRAVLVLLIHALVIVGIWLSWRPRGVARYCGMAVYAFTILLAWKSSCTRADMGHIRTLFVLTLFMAPWAWRLMADRGRRYRVAGALLMIATFGICAESMLFFGRQYERPITLTRTYNHLRRSAVRIFAPHPLLREMRERYGEAQCANDMPQTRARISDASVEVFGFEQGCAIVNRFNVQPRPVTQSYSAYSPELMAMNYAAVESRPPDWFLFKLQSIDHRLPTQDDSQVLAHILYNYEPVLEEFGFLLLDKREQARKVLPPGTLLLEKSIGFGEGLDLSNYRGKVLWMEVVTRQTFVGRALGLLYKNSPFVMKLRLADGEVRYHRFVPGCAAAGFIIQPVLRDTTDVAALYAHDKVAEINGLEIYPHFSWGLRGYEENIVVRVYELPALPSRI